MATTVSATASPTQADTVAPGAMPRRLISLDIFRGMTIAGMILVNNAGNWDAVYWPLEHAKWHGWTPTDLIFPFFLFIVGVSMVLSFDTRQSGGASRAELLSHAVRRSAIIYLIGFALALGGASLHLHTVRFYGVLPRIAAVYLAASVIVLYCGRRARVAIAAGLLVGYWLLMTRVPGFDLTMDGNLAGALDRRLLYNHLWIEHRFDPEGLLSTLPAIVTTLMGVFTGEWLRRREHGMSKVQGMVIAGGLCMGAGELWGRWFPINKNLWTSSYVLFTGGFALAALALCYWMVEIRGWRRWGAPFVWYGSNAITVYAASSALAVCSVKLHVRPGLTCKAWVYRNLFAPLAQPLNASALYASAYVLAFLVLAWVMYRNKIFVKI
ncbi:MAG: heparan-alpha-glucosaminide N-acetyltransferase domain-containing protein [Acidobacteriia bacterium]|nr:heparan-alpha-glucosaminide N-acetyltransferase domain-containing protein [Terriglobia bacterium]